MLRNLMAVALMAFPVSASAAVFADGLVSAINTTAFGSTLVTGAPDEGGRYLGSSSDPPAQLGELVVQFSGGVWDGAGTDLKIYDIIPSADETFDIFVSSNNSSYTRIGGFAATNALIDFNGLFAGPVFFVKLINTSREVSADIDAIEGFHTFGSAVPEPATWAMMLFGFGVIGQVLRRRTGAMRRRFAI